MSESNTSSHCQTMLELECPTGKLKEWIRFQLHSGMTFKNYAKEWRIEILENVCKDCRPMWQLVYPIKKDKNIYKGDNFSLLLQDIKVKMFELIEMKEDDEYEDPEIENEEIKYTYHTSLQEWNAKFGKTEPVVDR